MTSKLKDSLKKTTKPPANNELIPEITPEQQVILNAGDLKQPEVLKDAAKMLSNDSVAPPKEIKEVDKKFNIKLSKSNHMKFKTYCMFEGVSMEEKASSIVKIWLDAKKDVF